MDIMAILNTLNQGGPTVLFAILAGLMWMQHVTIIGLKCNLKTLTKEFKDFQISYANEKVRQEDLEELKILIKEHNATNKELVTRVFERLDAHASRCGRDCLASLHACAEIQGVTSRITGSSR
ncbi:MAG: hypothetical protein H7829_19255 [Magnetococcus sp. THC-1_WYH]